MYPINTTNMSDLVTGYGLTVQLNPIPCNHLCHSHENIKSYRAELILLRQPNPIGYIILHNLSKSAMEAIHPNRMWEECSAHELSHPASKLGKIENYLSNESFESDYEQVVADPEAIVYIEAVWLERSQRRQGHGLKAILLAVESLGCLPNRTILMLESGPMEETTCGLEEAGEKLARHWGRLGFSVWSDSDPTWLCLTLRDLGLKA